MFARMLRWSDHDTLGRTVAPEVKMISAVSPAFRRRRSDQARLRWDDWPFLPCLLNSDTRQIGRDSRALAIPRIADKHGTRIDDGSDPKQKICGGAIVNRNQHDALERASPHRDEPLGAILRSRS